MAQMSGMTGKTSVGHIWVQAFLQGNWIDLDTTKDAKEYPPVAYDHLLYYFENYFDEILTWDTKTAVIYGYYASLHF